MNEATSIATQLVNSAVNRLGQRTGTEFDSSDLTHLRQAQERLAEAIANVERRASKGKTKG